MNRTEWLACEDPGAMLRQTVGVHDFAGGVFFNGMPPGWRVPSERKLWLLFFAWERLDLSYGPPTEDSVELRERELRRAKCDVGERFADGLCEPAAVLRARWPDRPVDPDWRARPASVELEDYLDSPGDWLPGVGKAHCDILRCIVGDPWVPARLEPVCGRCDGDGEAHGSDRPFVWAGPGSYPGPCPVCGGAGHLCPWLTRDVATLAGVAYDTPDEGGHLDAQTLAVLSDALEEAGFQHPFLAHLRGPGPHHRGCAVIDVLTRRS